MLAAFHPSFRGVYRPEVLADDFIDRLAARVESGLFPMASAGRNRYAITERLGTRLRFQSVGIATGINIGLNDVAVRVDDRAPEISYEVSYWAWAKYSLFLCAGIAGVLGLVLLATLLGLPMSYGHLHLPTTLLLPIFVPMTLFWGVLWPWILIALHKRPAAKCLTRILDEVNATSS